MTYQTSQWREMPPLRKARIGLAGATARGLIYAISGFAHNQVFRSVEVRSLQGDRSWDHAPDLRIPRGNSSADTLKGLIYVVGGLIKGDALTDSVERFDPDAEPPAKAWTAVRNLPQPRAQAGVAAHDGLLYVAGGAENGDTNSMVAYDPDRNEWTNRAPLPPPARTLLRLMSAGDHLYAIGGAVGADRAVQTLMDRYDPASDSWERMASMNEPRANFGAATFGKDRRHILVVGGVEFSSGVGVAMRSSEVYDVDADKWETLDVQLPHARSAMVCALESDDTVLAIGGAVTEDDGSVVPADLVEAIRIDI